jgi:lysophospholipase L1-like esterase
MKNQINKPVILIGLTIAFLIGFQFIPKGIKVLNYETKKFDLFMDIKSDSILLQEAISINSFLPKEKMLTMAINREMIENLMVNLNIKPSLLAPMHMQTKVGLSGNLSNLNFFFQALKNSKTMKLRIAHYGDSGIEGDLITADIRQNFQNQFGGMGAGFLAITSQDITFRSTTKQAFSNDWKSGSLVTGNSDKLPIGISGFTFRPSSTSWVTYEATGRNNVRTFKLARLFYTNGKTSKIKYSFNNGGEQQGNIQTGTNVKELTLNANTDAKSFKLASTMQDQGDFFGVSLESDAGIYVDNFPLRGNSGVNIKDIPLNILSDFNKMLNYKLIILHFGLNILTSGAKEFSWYEREMIKVVEHLKQAFPQTSILIVSAGDRSIKVGTKFITDPRVPALITAQKNVAEKTGVVFWNLFDAMGGNNSMEKWVNANPSLAFKDYIHLNGDGAKKVANMLFDAIIEQFKKSK